MLCTKITRLLVVSFIIIFVTAPVMSSGQLLESPSEQKIVKSVTDSDDIGFLRQKSSGWFSWLTSRIKDLFVSNKSDIPYSLKGYVDETLFDENVSVDQRLKGLIDLNKKLDEYYPVISSHNEIALRLRLDILAALVDMFNNSDAEERTLRGKLHRAIKTIEKSLSEKPSEMDLVATAPKKQSKSHSRSSSLGGRTSEKQSVRNRSSSLGDKRSSQLPISVPIQVRENLPNVFGNGEQISNQRPPLSIDKIEEQQVDSGEVSQETSSLVKRKRIEVVSPNTSEPEVNEVSEGQEQVTSEESAMRELVQQIVDDSLSQPPSAEQKGRKAITYRPESTELPLVASKNISNERRDASSIKEVEDERGASLKKLQERVASVKELQTTNAKLLKPLENECKPQAFSLPKPRALQGLDDVDFFRSLRQPNDWVCAPMALYTAYKIDQWLPQNAIKVVLDDCLLNYRTYTFEDFATWYEQYIVDFNVYQESLSKEPLGGLLCPEPDITKKQYKNYLQSEQIEEVANKVLNNNDISQYIVLEPQEPGGSIYATGAENLMLQPDGPDYSNIRHANKDYLEELSEDFFANPMQKVLYLFANIQKHWFLIVVLKTNSDGARIVVFDSKNPLSKEEYGDSESIDERKIEEIKKLYNYFIVAPQRLNLLSQFESQNLENDIETTIRRYNAKATGEALLEDFPHVALEKSVRSEQKNLSKDLADGLNARNIKPDFINVATAIALQDSPITMNTLEELINNKDDSALRNWLDEQNSQNCQDFKTKILLSYNRAQLVVECINKFLSGAKEFDPDVLRDSSNKYDETQIPDLLQNNKERLLLYQKALGTLGERLESVKKAECFRFSSELDQKNVNNVDAEIAGLVKAKEESEGTQKSANTNIEDDLSGFFVISASHEPIKTTEDVNKFIAWAKRRQYVADEGKSQTIPTVDKVVRWIEQGEHYAHQLFNTDQEIALPFGQELEPILSLIWYFYMKAYEKGQAFEQGAFMIEDPDDRLYDLLMRYAQKKNNDIKTMAPVKISSNKYAYKRLSSHLKHSRSEDDPAHYGIDIRLADNARPVPYLPTLKKHLLFGKVKLPYSEKKLLFIKPEDAGLYYADGALDHGLDFVISLGRKTAPSLFGSDDEARYRKERIPKEIVSAIKKHLPREKDLLTAVQKYGIQAWHKVVNPNDFSDPKNLYYNGLIGSGNKGYDHPAIRHGREVILTREEFLPQSQ